MYADKEKGSWVVVTGGTEGIGVQICKQMAALGFNVCLIGRSKEKMDTFLANLQKEHPKIKVNFVVFDFTKYTQITDYREMI